MVSACGDALPGEVSCMPKGHGAWLPTEAELTQGQVALNKSSSPQDEGSLSQ